MTISELLSGIFRKQRREKGRLVGRQRTRDAAFTFRMGAGFAGDVSRTHPVSVKQNVQDGTNPVPAFGVAVLYGTNTVRGFLAGDTTTPVATAGISVRPFPINPSSATNFGAVALGAGNTPPAAGVIDVLTEGYANVFVLVGATAVVIGGPVYVRIAASSGSHVQGGFESTADTLGTNTVLLKNAQWASVPDANGIAEIYTWPSN